MRPGIRFGHVTLGIKPSVCAFEKTHLNANIFASDDPFKFL